MSPPARQPPAWNVTRELRIEQGPVVIAQTDTDPGDMGEPRVFDSDGVTYVAVPDFEAHWSVPADRESEAVALLNVDSAIRAYLTRLPKEETLWLAVAATDEEPQPEPADTDEIDFGHEPAAEAGTGG